MYVAHFRGASERPIFIRSAISLATGHFVELLPCELTRIELGAYLVALTSLKYRVHGTQLIVFAEQNGVFFSAAQAVLRAMCMDVQISLK